jgi:transcription initiation factor TFIID subunit 8
MSDDYARAAARVAAAQLTEAAGFDSAQRSSLEVLSDLLLRYIQELGSSSHAYAELAGRAESNALDVVKQRATARA